MLHDILKKDWYSIGKDPRTYTDILESITYDTMVNIGSDAQAFGKDTINIVTCICVHNVGKGGLVFYHNEKKVSFHNLWEKLYLETMLSLSCATELTALKPKIQDNIIVHVDANPKKIHASSDFVKQLAGLCMGYGFNYILKPNAWAASHVADHLVKNKNHKA